MTDDDISALMRNHGLRVTAQRLALMRAVTAKAHVTADEIALQVRDDIGSVSRQAVYDTLAVFVEAGLLRRIQPAGSPARYERRVADNHHHLICRDCGRIVDVDNASGDVPELTATTDHGFVVDEAEVIYWGHCAICQTSPASA